MTSLLFSFFRILHIYTSAYMDYFNIFFRSFSKCKLSWSERSPDPNCFRSCAVVFCIYSKNALVDARVLGAQNAQPVSDKLVLFRIWGLFEYFNVLTKISLKTKSLPLIGFTWNSKMFLAWLSACGYFCNYIIFILSLSLFF